MKTFLFYSKRFVWGIALLGAITTSNAQQIKGTQAVSSSQRITGKQIYHQSKLYDSKGSSKKAKVERVKEDVEARMKYDFERLKVPGTNKVPEGIREAELQFSSKIQVGNDSKQSLSGVSSKSSRGRSFSNWKNRGPFNVGGRTRALAIDRTNENVIFAGGVSGGLWRSTNGGSSWRKVTTKRQSPSITAIVQDPRRGRHNTWYYGSGERFGNSAGAGGAFFQGRGIYKSNNGGRTWRLLEASNDNEVGAFGPLDLINSMAINPVNGDLYVGTIFGVQRSQDGGLSFEEVLPGGFDSKAEVMITPSGQIYAAFDSEGDPNRGYFTSRDGDNWTDISPPFFTEFPGQFGRTKMKADPANEDLVYFFTETIGVNGLTALLLKYDAVAATPEEAWVDLSANLPTTIGGSVGSLNLQGGYNMVLEVSPADSNLMFVGGTNIYRSTTGFTTPTGQESWVAGYSPINNVSIYPGQHPDQHAMLFYPSNPNKVLSAHDGGVSVTEDITTSTSQFEPVVWTSLSNGYLTTQPYHVSFDPEANSDDLIAGFQDNSTWYTNSTDSRATWVDLFGGDGSYSAIADGGRTRYVSSQRGRLHRLNYDEEGALISFARVQPAGASGFSFIAPFILDHNNDNIMYMPSGNRIWRNNNLDEIPFISSEGNSVFAGAPATVNWVQLPNSDTPAGSIITSLDVSTYPVANILYYGTNQGGVYRMNNANLDGQEAVDVTADKGLPAGTVNDINVDPSNPDRVIITFSNYGVLSLFLTENGGETWTNISGNLEENADGSGNGPSVRSTAFFGGSTGFLGARQQRVYAATSTGLYYARRLNGERTRWIKEQLAIGNAVTDEVVTRKDGFIAVAAHGSGLYSARFPLLNELPELSLSVAYALRDTIVNIKNPMNAEVDVTDLFVQSNGEPIDIQFANSNPDMVTATLEGNTIKLVYSEELTLGDQAVISLVATSGEEQVSEGFTITVAELPFYEQNEGAIGSAISQFFPDFGALVQAADDFRIPEGDTWTIERILAFGSVRNTPALTSVNVIIYEDNNGVPGEEEIYNSGEIAPISSPGDANLNLQLPEAIQLESGNYWLSVYVNLAFNPGANQWFWASQNAGIGSETLFRDEADLVGEGAIDWTPYGPIFIGNPIDQVFQLFGTTDTTGEEEVKTLTQVDTVLSTVTPNPSNGEFVFRFNNNAKSSLQKASIDIYNVMGAKVYSKSGVDLRGGFVWDAGNNVSGMYLVNIIEGSNLRQFKVVKN